MGMHNGDFESSRAESGSTDPKAASGSSRRRREDAVEDCKEAVPNWRTIIWCMLTNPLLRMHSAWLCLEIVWLRWRLRRQGIDPDSIPGIQELRLRQEEAKRKRGKATSQGQ
jgi:hypothetical protein